uniref:non-specific serine/threonine protein kinase n=1 Tax=Neobodo designis TaxID=312471 RepID=A0A7S1M7B8_NEODS|mmetsp:Transcript_3544/g.11032  ORF Transcript_3544/g.11032 Transcript_3544/m.11032 type:complete len:613 (+) Transcript_3544:281-2119(+)
MSADGGDVCFADVLGPAPAPGKPAAFKYTYVQYLGRGGYGLTWVVKRTADDEKIVVKILSLQAAAGDAPPAQHKSTPSNPATVATGVASQLREVERTSFERVRAEMDNLEAISDHFGCTRLLDKYLINGHALLFLEFCDAGDLHHEISRMRKRGQYFGEDTAKIIFLQLLFALYHLHRMRMMHRDVKASNVLLCTSGLVKVGDFGLSATVEVAKTFCGTPTHLAPEVWERQQYGQRADIWSLGIVVYHILALQIPFTSRQYDTLRRQVCNGDYVRMSERNTQYSREFVDLCERMLTQDAARRPSALDLLRDPAVVPMVNRWPDLLANSSNVSQALRDDIMGCLVRDEVLALDSQGVYRAGPVLTLHQEPAPYIPPGGAAPPSPTVDGEHFAVDSDKTAAAVQRDSQLEDRLATAPETAEGPSAVAGILQQDAAKPAMPGGGSPTMKMVKKGIVWKAKSKGALWDPRGLLMHELSLALFPIERHVANVLVHDCVDSVKDGDFDSHSAPKQQTLRFQEVADIHPLPPVPVQLSAIGVDPAEGEADSTETLYPIRLVRRDNKQFDIAMNAEPERDEWLALMTKHRNAGTERRRRAMEDSAHASSGPVSPPAHGPA